MAIENYRRKNEARKLYNKLKDKDGNLVTDPECMLQKWREYFSKLLVPEITDENMIEKLILADDVDCHPPDQNEVQTAITRLKNN